MFGRIASVGLAFGKPAARNIASIAVAFGRLMAKSVFSINLSPAQSAPIDLRSKGPASSNAIYAISAPKEWAIKW